MAQKAEIQYVSQFFDYGSDDKPQKKPKKKKPFVPRRPEKIHKISLDPVALLGIVSAVVLCAALIFGGLHLNAMWKEHVALKDYLSQLKVENAELQHNFSVSFNLDEIKTMADSIGLVPESEVETRYVRITPPQPEPEPGFLDNLLWFFKGLFAYDPESPIE